MTNLPPLETPSIVRTLRFLMPCAEWDVQRYFETYINGALLESRDKQYRAAKIEPNDPKRNPDVTWYLDTHEKTDQPLLVLEISYADPNRSGASRDDLFAEKYARDMEQTLYMLLRKGMGCEKLPSPGRYR